MAYQSIHLGTKIDEGVTRALNLPSTDTGKGASQVGIEDADGNYSGTNVEAALAESAGQISAAAGNLSTHTTNVSNPHGTTAAQIGALSLTGGTITGEVTIAYPQALKVRHIDGSSGGEIYLNYNNPTMQIIMYSGGTNGYAYHTGNITISTAAPASALAEGFQHQVY